MPISISKTTVEKILKAFKINSKTVKIYSQEKGYRNTVIPVELQSGEKLAVIIFKQEPEILDRIKRSNAVTLFLAENGWPVRRPLTNNNEQSILKLSLKDQSCYCCVYNYLPGSTINWESYTQKHIKLLGQVLGYLHQDLENFESQEGFFENQEVLMLEDILSEMSIYFSKKTTLKALTAKLKLNPNKEALKYFKQLLKNLKKIEPQQALHMDFVRSNLLFKTKKIDQINNLRFAFDPAKQKKSRTLTISGILDFEKTAQGPKIVDLSRSLAFLLVDCKYKTEKQVRKYFLYSGYQKRGKQNIEHRELINPLVKFFLFYDFYKFLKHNPYEFLEQNEHFVRTRDYLVDQRMLELIETEL